MECSAPECDYTTPRGMETHTLALEALKLHVQTAHPPLAAAGHVERPASKVDKRQRPEARMEMSEHDWRFFESEWADYKSATGIKGSNLLNELWSCMTDDLRRLAFDQGGKESLTNEALMTGQMKQLAVTVLHAAVHTVTLHEARQMPEEPTKAFAGRVRGIANDCSLSKVCPNRACNSTVSFLEETVYHVVLAGLRDREMQERCLSGAILGRISNIASLVEHCGAEESGRMTTPTLGAVRSSYQKGKQSEIKTRPVPPSTASARCGFCDGQAHSSSSRQTREKECKAFNMTCRSCSKVGHQSSCCRSKQKPKARNSAIEAEAKTEEDGTVQSFGFHGIRLLRDTYNQFQPPEKLADKEFKEHRTHVRRSTAGYSRRPYPAVICPGAVQVPSPLSSSPPSATPNTLGSITVRQLHMEYEEGPDGTWKWVERPPDPSPTMLVGIQVDLPSYSANNLPPPSAMPGRQIKPITVRVVADSGAQMFIGSDDTRKELGIEASSLFPVKARVFGASRGAEIDIVGGSLLAVGLPGTGNPNIKTPPPHFCMVYWAKNVSRNYLPMSAMKAMGLVSHDFPSLHQTPRSRPSQLAALCPH